MTSNNLRPRILVFCQTNVIQTKWGSTIFHDTTAKCVDKHSLNNGADVACLQFDVTFETTHCM